MLATAAVTTVALTAALLTGGVASFPLVSAAEPSESSSSRCADVELVFARGTGEAPGLGTVGTALSQALGQTMPGWRISTYAVSYAAELSQASAGPGATDLTKHVTATAQSCPNTQFILAGYSQGATVVDIALGITGTAIPTGEALPGSVTTRVAAIVTYGNPLGALGRTISDASPNYGSRTQEFCNQGDPVCGSGTNVFAHLTYATNGTAIQGARFAAQQAAD